ncbi:MAG: hypothetical protein PWQ10_303 [Patescibacteria group bacterium]|nr:hypothetical protein [Patescibacteria group bacterium]
MTVIGEYFEKIGVSEKAELERIREIVNTTVPEAEEIISYDMPAFNYRGKYLIGFYVFNKHISLFPTAKPINAMRSKLGNYKLSKGAIEFTLENTIPESLIRKLIMYRIEDIDRELE